MKYTIILDFICSFYRRNY